MEVGVGERVLASGRWEPLERYSNRTMIPRISASPEARKSLACPGLATLRGKRALGCETQPGGVGSYLEHFPSKCSWWSWS